MKDINQRIRDTAEALKKAEARGQTRLAQELRETLKALRASAEVSEFT